MNQRGIALFSAILMGVALLLIGIGISASIISGRYVSSQIAQKDESLNIADAGMEWAVSNFDPNNLAALVATGSFGNGMYEIFSPTTLVANQRYLLRSTSYLPSKQAPKYSRTVQAIILAQQGQGLPYAIAAGGDITLSGNVKINSTPTPHQGNIHANGDVTSSGNVTVDGTATAVGRNSIDTSKAHAPAVILPTLTNAQIKSYYQEALSSGRTYVNDFNGTLSGYFCQPGSTPLTPSGSFNLSGNSTLTSSGVVYIDGDLKISGNTTLHGSGTIIVGGSISFSGNTSIDGSICMVSLSSDSSAIKISGNVSYGTSSSGPIPSTTLFAPFGGVKISGNQSLQGSLVAGGGVTMSGNASVTRVTTTNSSMLTSTTWKTINWREITP